MQLTGKLIRSFGFESGAWFRTAIEAAGNTEFASEAEAKGFAASFIPTKLPVISLRTEALPFSVCLETSSSEEEDNLNKVKEHMKELMRLPTVVAGAVMPDACPAGQELGTIPVGGVVAAKEAIHPGMHSADICCSMAISYFKEADAKKILDTAMILSRFGVGGRTDNKIRPSFELMDALSKNPYTNRLLDTAVSHMATQGDGNHFFYVGRSRHTGDMAIVTHHGSRGLGAGLYKEGMHLAEGFRSKISPETGKHNAWIPSETREGEEYWKALQLIREWTKQNHFLIHHLVTEALGIKPIDQFWNEHNFLFRKSDGLFYHGKGATPAWKGYASDSTGLTIIPLNMAEPILIVEGKNQEAALGFAPHGAGRNYSRTAFGRLNEGRTPQELIAEQAPNIDVRYFNGVADISELPGAYKNANEVVRQIKHFGLAEIVDYIDPLGNIMAGDSPWNQNRKNKKQEASK